MMTYRLRYTQILVIWILTGLFYSSSQSLAAGINGLEINLPFRNTLISSFTRLRLKLKDHVFTQGIAGKDGWLFYTNPKTLDFYQNVDVLGPAGRESVRNNLQLLYDKLRQRNIQLLVVIAPDKETIYPDKLPEEITKIGPNSELDMLVNLLQEKGPPVLLDLRPALIKSSQERQLYYKTDTHWNIFGALIAYREIMTRLAQQYPDLKPTNIDNIAKISESSGVMDIAQLIGASYLREVEYNASPAKQDVIWITHNNDSLPMQVSISRNKKSPKLLMYYDSFGKFIVPYLAPHFSQATFIQNLNLNPGLSTFDEINASEADIVILEFVERYQPNLNSFLNNYSLETVK
jgi:hypothetical protein